MGHCGLLGIESYCQRYLVNTGAQYTLKGREEAQKSKEFFFFFSCLVIELVDRTPNRVLAFTEIPCLKWGSSFFLLRYTQPVMKVVLKHKLYSTAKEWGNGNLFNNSIQMETPNI